jgi:hypothetical protein
MKNGSVFEGEYESAEVKINVRGVVVTLKYKDIKTATYLIPSELPRPDGEVYIKPPHTS